MTKLFKELIRLHSVEGQPKIAVLAQTCMGIFFILSVSDTIFTMLFLPKPLADRRGPPD
jgi:amino acid transporter